MGHPSPHPRFCRFQDQPQACWEGPWQRGCNPALELQHTLVTDVLLKRPLGWPQAIQTQCNEDTACLMSCPHSHLSFPITVLHELHQPPPGQEQGAQGTLPLLTWEWPAKTTALPEREEERTLCPSSGETVHQELPILLVAERSA